MIDQTHKQIVFFGDPDLPGDYDQTGTYHPSGWEEVKAWPDFTRGGALTDANVAPMEFMVNGIAKSVKGLRLTN